MASKSSNVWALVDFLRMAGCKYYSYATAGGGVYYLIMSSFQPQKGYTVMSYKLMISASC